MPAPWVAYSRTSDQSAPVTSALGGPAPILPAAEFGNLLTDFIGDVNKAQIDASKSTQSFVNGEAIEIHGVMIAGAKAKTSLELLMEIRNKTVDMYRELTRMSV